jgi:CBS-domain-containing membrane protein
MIAADVMNRTPTTLKSTDTIRTASQYIMKYRCRQLPVVDEEGHYVGIFGVNCLLKQVLPKAAIMEKGLESLSFIHEDLSDLHARLQSVEDKPITVCMNTEAFTVPPDHPMLDTLLLLYRTRTSIPVVDPDSGMLLGMVSYWDIGERILSA